MKCILLFIFIGVLHADDADPLRFKEEIEAYKISDALHPPQDGVYLFVGSSSIRMWKTLEEDFAGFPVLNRGFGGSHFSDAIYFLGEIVKPYKPKKIIIYEGDNDIASGKTLEVIFNDFRRLIEMIQEELGDPEIAVISPKPSPSRWHLKGEYESLNRMMENYCKNHDKLTYIDVYTHMLNGSGKPEPELFVSDSLHMNEKGYKLWKDLVLPFLYK